MKSLKKIILITALLTVGGLVTAFTIKYIKHQNMYKKYPWQGQVKVPVGYPATVFGTLYAKDGEDGDPTFASLSVGVAEVYENEEEGITFPHWGISGSPGFNDFNPKIVPQTIFVNWISYVDGYDYYLEETPLDTQRIKALFKEGYYSPAHILSKIATPEKRNYEYIQVGVAPGGVVIVWVAGEDRIVEVGRYQATKKEEIHWLDKEDPSKFVEYTKRWRDRVLKRNEPKSGKSPLPVPYGLWDKYRTRYRWKANIEAIDRTKIQIRSISYSCFNGEVEELFGERTWRENQIEKYNIPPTFQWTYLKERAVPEFTTISWYDEEDVRYTIALGFDEKEVFEAFEKAFKGQENQEGELLVYINTQKTDAALTLKVGERKVALFNFTIDLYKSAYQNQ